MPKPTEQSVERMKKAKKLFLQKKKNKSTTLARVEVKGPLVPDSEGKSDDQPKFRKQPQHLQIRTQTRRSSHKGSSTLPSVELEFQEESRAYSSREQRKHNDQQQPQGLELQELSRPHFIEEQSKLNDQQQSPMRFELQKQSMQRTEQASPRVARASGAIEATFERRAEQAEEQQQVPVRLDFEEQPSTYSREELTKQGDRQQPAVRIKFQYQSMQYSSEEQPKHPVRLELQELSRPHLSEEQSKPNDQQLPERKAKQRTFPASRVQTRRSSARPEIQGQSEPHSKEGDQKQQLPERMNQRVQTRRSSARLQIQDQLEAHSKEDDQKQPLLAHFHRQKEQPKRQNKSNHQHPNAGKLSHHNLSSQQTTKMGSTIHPHSLHQSPSIGLEAADVDSVCKFKSLSQTAFQASPDNELHEPGDIPVKLELKEEPQPQLSVSPATVRSRVQTRRSSARPEIQGQLETHFKEGDQKQQLPAHFHRQKQQPKAAAKQRKNKSNHQHPNTGKLSHDNVASQKTTEMGSTIHPHSFDQLPSIGLEAADVDLVCKFESLSQTAFQASPDNELLERGGISVKLEPQEESQPQLSVSPATARPNQASPGDEGVRDSFDGWRVHSIVPVAEIKSTVLQIEFGFRFKSENFPIKGTMRYYDCRRIKFRSRPQCERKLLVFIPNSDVPATISIRGKHTCATAPPEHLARTKLNEQQSDLIEGLLKSGIPSKDIKKHVRVVNSTVSKNQLNYAVKSTRQKLFGNGVFSIATYFRHHLRDKRWTGSMLQDCSSLLLFFF